MAAKYNAPTRPTSTDSTHATAGSHMTLNMFGTPRTATELIIFRNVGFPMVTQTLFSSSLFQSTEDVNAFDARDDARITVTVFGGCLFIQFFFGAIDTIDADDLFRRCERMEGAEHRYFVSRRALSSHLLRGKTKTLPRVSAEEFHIDGFIVREEFKEGENNTFYSTTRATA